MTEYDKLHKSQLDFYNSGATKSYEFRMEQLKKLKNAVKICRDDIFKALKKDLNKSTVEAYLTEINFVEKEIDYTIAHLAGWMKNKYVFSDLYQFPGVSKIYHDPYGVVLIMSPWNYPFQLTLVPLIGSIAGGNCTIVKPSAYAKHTSAVIKKVLDIAFDDEYVAVVEGGREENAKLLDLKFNYIFFTGSVNVGKVVMKKAAEHLTPVTLELGGKSPCIVDSTANLDVAAKRIIWGKSINAGQTCVAPDYVYVHKSVKDELVKKMKEELLSTYGENGLSTEHLPKIINDNHFKRLVGYFDGANVVFGGKSDPETRQIELSLLELDDENHPVMQSEIFGPILPIIEYTSLSSLIKSLKEKAKPLALYLFTTSKVNREQVLQELQFGGGCVNETVLHIVSSSMPFGGVGESGMGGYHGKSSFTSFTREKGVLIKPNIIDFSFRYPKNWKSLENKVEKFKKIIKK